MLTIFLSKFGSLRCQGPQLVPFRGIYFQFQGEEEDFEGDIWFKRMVVSHVLTRGPP